MKKDTLIKASNQFQLFAQSQDFENQHKVMQKNYFLRLRQNKHTV